MPASKAEQVLNAPTALLQTVPDASLSATACCRRRSDGGLIILRDGDPSEPEQALGGFGNAYYQHAVEIEVYVEEATPRPTPLSTPSRRSALYSKPTRRWAGTPSATYGRPEPSIEPIAGAPALKSATLTVTIDYETDAPLA